MAGTSFNVSSMISQHRLRLHHRAITTSIERLATGSRINQSKDDPFRNNESLKVNGEIESAKKARQNSTDGAALLQIAEGTCNEVQSILHRIRELAIQSANDTLTSTERQYLNIESTGLLKEIDRIVGSTTYNSKVVFGNKGDSFSGEGRNLADWVPFTGPDGKSFTARDANGNATSRAGVLHVGPSTSIPEEIKVTIPDMSAESLGLGTLSITYQGGATRAIDDLDSALSSVSTFRSYMGTLVNRLDMQVDYLDDRNISLTDYSSKIRDTDIAKESTNMISGQIKQQAAMSILAQSNARYGRVMELLAR